MFHLPFESSRNINFNTKCFKFFSYEETFLSCKSKKKEHEKLKNVFRKSKTYVEVAHLKFT